MNRPWTTRRGLPVTLIHGDALDATGSVSYSVVVDGLPIGYVGDSREPGRLGRRWFACASIIGDAATVAAAMWDSGPAYRTRRAALDALVRHVQKVAR
ncbi:hypothetical protein [Saccharomonospora cyanea]|uniref:Uncharacterized protein n=1 Tax=Saccharomonospora cyanea NA-134 TaxID=882082 RepID=H5XG61_9PSEU|nr:hypothetical protein [Saccharomonospora cyanea]EHR62643.1 hypothetical protein SaccyDRAFT_3816 [Saccharomonospora cyanea NA-134]